MAVLMHARISGVSAEQYDAIIESIQESLGGETPDGAVFHVAGPVEEDWQIVEVWESEDHHKAFVDEYVVSAMSDAGIDGEPETVIQYWELHSEVDL